VNQSYFQLNLYINNKTENWAFKTLLEYLTTNSNFISLSQIQTIEDDKSHQSQKVCKFSTQDYRRIKQVTELREKQTKSDE